MPDLVQDVRVVAFFDFHRFEPSVLDGDRNFDEISIVKSCEVRGPTIIADTDVLRPPRPLRTSFRGCCVGAYVLILDDRVC